MMFLNEILEVLEVCEITKLEPLVNKLFKRLIKCIAGPHLQVNNEIIFVFKNIMKKRLQTERCVSLKMIIF